MSAPTVVRFNPFDPAFRTNPYPQYRALREQAPVHRSLGMWVLTRHADVTAALRDRSTSASLIPELLDRQTTRLAGARSDGTRPASCERTARLARTSLVFTDPPAHNRLRTLVGRVLSPRAVAGLRSLAQAEADRLLEPLWRDGEFDAITGLASPLPLRVLTGALALPGELRERVGRWTHQVRFLLEPGLLDGERLDELTTAVDAFAEALRDLALERRATPGEDLLSALAVSTTPDGDQLDDEELVLVAMMTFVAGLETTTALIGNGLHALLTHPDQGALLRAEPDRIAAAVPELLRFDSPLQMTKRRTTRDSELGGATIPAGSQLLLCLGAANHDPEVFPDPDTLDVTRAAATHLAYGRGMHGCVGASLASLIAEAALTTLLTGPAGLSQGEGRVTWQEHSQIVRGVATLPVTAR